jgi:sigma-E factor negative regulatory protein RseC
MIEESAIVVGLEQNTAMIEIVRRTPCGLCGQTRGCGISLWGRLFGHRKNIFKAANQINAKVGDSVIVGIDEQALLISSLMVYGVPLGAMLTGALLVGGIFAGDSNHVNPGHADFYAVMGAVAGLIIGLLWLKGHATGRSMDVRYQPVILRADSQIDNSAVINLK